MRHACRAAGECLSWLDSNTARPWDHFRKAMPSACDRTLWVRRLGKIAKLSLALVPQSYEGVLRSGSLPGTPTCRSPSRTAIQNEGDGQGNSKFPATTPGTVMSSSRSSHRRAKPSNPSKRLHAQKPVSRSHATPQAVFPYCGQGRSATAKICTHGLASPRVYGVVHFSHPDRNGFHTVRFSALLVLRLFSTVPHD